MSYDFGIHVAICVFLFLRNFSSNGGANHCTGNESHNISWQGMSENGPTEKGEIISFFAKKRTNRATFCARTVEIGIFQSSRMSGTPCIMTSFSVRILECGRKHFMRVKRMKYILVENKIETCRYCRWVIVGFKAQEW